MAARLGWILVGLIGLSAVMIVGVTLTMHDADARARSYVRGPRGTEPVTRDGRWSVVVPTAKRELLSLSLEEPRYMMRGESTFVMQTQPSELEIRKEYGRIETYREGSAAWEARRKALLELHRLQVDKNTLEREAKALVDAGAPESEAEWEAAEQVQPMAMPGVLGHKVMDVRMEALTPDPEEVPLKVDEAPHVCKQDRVSMRRQLSVVQTSLNHTVTYYGCETGEEGSGCGVCALISTDTGSSYTQSAGMVFHDAVEVFAVVPQPSMLARERAKAHGRPHKEHHTVQALVGSAEDGLRLVESRDAAGLEWDSVSSSDAREHISASLMEMDDGVGTQAPLYVSGPVWHVGQQQWLLSVTREGSAWQEGKCQGWKLLASKDLKTWRVHAQGTGLSLEPRALDGVEEVVHRVHLHISDDAGTLIVAVVERSVRLVYHGIRLPWNTDRTLIVSSDGIEWHRVSRDRYLDGTTGVEDADEGGGLYNGLAWHVSEHGMRTSMVEAIVSEAGVLRLQRHEVRRNGWVQATFPMSADMYSKVGGFVDYKQYIKIPGVYTNEAITRPMWCRNNSEIVVNYHTSTLGSVWLTALDHQGEPIGHHGQRCDTLWGNYEDAVATWRPRTRLILPHHAMVVYFRIEVEGDGKLYSVQCRQAWD